MKSSLRSARDGLARHRRVATLLDWLGLGCLALGETIGGFLWPGRLFLWFSPMFWAGFAVLAIRHTVWPRPSLPGVLADKARMAWRREDVRRSWAVALASRMGVLLVGLVFVFSVGYTLRPLQFRVTRNEVANLPARFDAGWYLGIARRGYHWEERLRGHRQNIAFFPAYPALMRVGGDVVTVAAKATRDPDLFGGGNARVLWGGALASMLCFGWALLQVFRLVQLEDPGGATSLRAIGLLAAYPFSLFFSAAYSESLFLLLAASTVLAWYGGRLRDAGLCGLLAGLTRSNGWTLSAGLLVGLIAEHRSRERVLPRALVAMCPVAGAMLFSAYVWHLTGNPIEWARAQEGWGGSASVAFLTRRLLAMRTDGFLGYVLGSPVDAITGVAVVWALGMSAVLAARRQWLYAAFSVCYLAPAIAIDLPASGRMTSVLFPAFIATATLVRGRPCVVLAALFAIGQACLAGRFFLWQPPY